MTPGEVIPPGLHVIRRPTPRSRPARPPRAYDSGAAGQRQGRADDRQGHQGWGDPESAWPATSPGHALQGRREAVDGPTFCLTQRDRSLGSAPSLHSSICDLRQRWLYQALHRGAGYDLSLPHVWHDREHPLVDEPADRVRRCTQNVCSLADAVNERLWVGQTANVGSERLLNCIGHDCLDDGFQGHERPREVRKRRSSGPGISAAETSWHRLVSGANRPSRSSRSSRPR